MKAYQESNLTYQQLIYKQIQTIQNITAKELRDSTKVIKNLIGEQVMEAEDTRFSYLQSVELLGSMLSPYFNTIITTEFDDYCSLCDMELIDALKDGDFSKDVKKLFNITEDTLKNISNNDDIKNQINVYFLNEKIKVARKMFRSLVKLFKNNSFLSEESYGDTPGSEGTNESLDAIGEEEDLL
jgi:hypothetical protein